ncbi:MAG: hypothetical protein A2074_01990 [Candidatus Aquicultor primus]|uniref:Uncharacterized protein n=1 Tax=Candidatus Aquicultor primus TaxID=1797195 RepID=A0A1F2ULP0_9ACTN|nr:MAG: hypothetical protein A2074_01990 [Candidatus Aquicultor primus]
MGKRASIRKDRTQRIQPGIGKAVVITLAVLILISITGVGVRFFSKGPATDPPTQQDANQPIIDDKQAIIEKYNKSEFVEVIPSLEKYLSRNPNDQEVRELLASAYLLSGNGARSVKEYQTILKSKPDDADTLYKIGVVLQHMDRGNEAITYLNQAVQAAPDVILFHSELARANSRAKFYREAIEEWKIVLNLLPPADKARASALAEIANIYILQGEFALAKEAIVNGLKIEPASDALIELEKKLGGQIQVEPAPSLEETTGGN